ncbi:hypothetical protein GCM10020295_18260 [Streptomyces cinereospinus]
MAAARAAAAGAGFGACAEALGLPDGVECGTVTVPPDPALRLGPGDRTGRRAAARCTAAGSLRAAAVAAAPAGDAPAGAEAAEPRGTAVAAARAAAAGAGFGACAEALGLPDGVECGTVTVPPDPALRLGPGDRTGRRHARRRGRRQPVRRRPRGRVPAPGPPAGPRRRVRAASGAGRRVTPPRGRRDRPSPPARAHRPGTVSREERQASPATRSATDLRRPVKNGTSSRTCSRASEPRR